MRNSSGHSLVELGVGVFLLVIVALISSNIYVLSLGKAYNDRICRDSIDLGARVALDGKDTEAVQKAARAGMDSCGYGGIFIGHPQYTAFKDEMSREVRVLKLQTQTIVNLPAAFLCFGKEGGPKVVFTSDYEYLIKNPKRPVRAADVNTESAPEKKPEESAKTQESVKEGSKKDSEKKDSEKKDSEKKDSEKKDSEKKDSEKKDAVTPPSPKADGKLTPEAKPENKTDPKPTDSKSTDGKTADPKPAGSKSAAATPAPKVDGKPVLAPESKSKPAEKPKPPSAKP
ncbi:MAG: hypothetical protein K2X93_06400 [Candidatus Obscuribacterales bacterium]|nr:hypothetical protein [Candidatus Obscuribacterales bacterium]